MFCYARGSCLVRDKLRNWGVPKSYGFVVKNERGDSIYGESFIVCMLSNGKYYLVYSSYLATNIMLALFCHSFLPFIFGTIDDTTAE